MGFGIKLKIWGDYACFTRPEMKVERVSYDVITPSAARGIIESIYWKPAIKWIIDKIVVYNPIRFDSIRRNEIQGKILDKNVIKVIKGSNEILYQDANDGREQRASYVLRDVCYIIEAHFELTEKAGDDDTKEKHYNIALRRMKKGQCYHQPCFGCREFPVYFEYIEDSYPPSLLEGKNDLGFMLYDIDFDNDMKAFFYRAIMVDGIIDVRKCLQMGELS